MKDAGQLDVERGKIIMSILFLIFATLFFAICFMAASTKYKSEKNKTVLFEMIGSGTAVLGGIVLILSSINL